MLICSSFNLVFNSLLIGGALQNGSCARTVHFGWCFKAEVATPTRVARAEGGNRRERRSFFDKDALHGVQKLPTFELPFLDLRDLCALSATNRAWLRISRLARRSPRTTEQAPDDSTLTNYFSSPFSDALETTQTI